MKHLIPILAAAVILTTCASNPSGNNPRTIPADIAGIAHVGRTNSQQEYALLDRLGASWTLITFSWSIIEPADDQWSFDYYEEFADAAKEAGKKIIGVLAYDIGWIHEDGKTHRNIPPDKLDYFLDYVRKTVAHYQGRVDAWCIWNEPNTTHFWTGTMDDFFLLTRRAADAVKETDPNVTLLAGAFNRGYLGLPNKFIKGMFESGAMEKVDAIAFHPYELNPARAATLYKKFRTLVGKYGFADRIWVTEMGYPTGGKMPTKVAEKRFPEYVVKTFVNLSLLGADKIIWYQLFDPVVREDDDSEDFFGLVRSREDYSSKGSEAFRLCATYISGTVYRPDLPQRSKLSGSLKTYYFEQPTGGGTLVLWKDGISTQVTLKSPDNSSFIVHDPVSGSATVMPAGTVLKIDKVPVFVTWQGNGVLVIE